MGEAVTITKDEVKAAVDALAFGYERLVLIVGPPGSGKSSVLRDAAEQRRWPVTNLGLELAQRMLGCVGLPSALFSRIISLRADADPVAPGPR